MLDYKQKKVNSVTYNTPTNLSQKINERNISTRLATPIVEQIGGISSANKSQNIQEDEHENTNEIVEKELEMIGVQTARNSIENMDRD